MSMNGSGFDPVAQFREVNGDLYQHASSIAEQFPDDMKMVSVVNGGVYLCRVVDYDDAHWKVIAEVGEGKTGAWDSETDKMANDLSDADLVVDNLGGHERYLVFVEQ